MAELGLAAEQRGDAETALARHRQGYAAARATGDPRAIAPALEGLAGVMSPAGEGMAEAAGLVGAARGIRRSVGAPLPAGERLDVGRITRRAREALGEEAVASGE